MSQTIPKPLVHFSSLECRVGLFGTSLFDVASLTAVATVIGRVSTVANIIESTPYPEPELSLSLTKPNPTTEPEPESKPKLMR